MGSPPGVSVYRAGKGSGRKDPMSRRGQKTSLRRRVGSSLHWRSLHGARSVTFCPELFRDQTARLVARKDPELMRGARGADVEQVARLVVLGVARLVHLNQDHVVELEPLDLPDVRDVDAGLEREVLLGDPA